MLSGSTRLRNGPTSADNSSPSFSGRRTTCAGSNSPRAAETATGSGLPLRAYPAIARLAPDLPAALAPPNTEVFRLRQPMAATSLGRHEAPRRLAGKGRCRKGEDQDGGEGGNKARAVGVECTIHSAKVAGPRAQIKRPIDSCVMPQSWRAEVGRAVLCTPP